MPLRIPDKLPAIDILMRENIFVMDNSRATTQDIRPLRIVVLNLMPLKITTETDLIRLLSNTPLQLEVSFMKLQSHTPKNTPIAHMMSFYEDFATMRNQKFDGMIVTGAPVEHLPFEEVSYWDEVTEIFEWAKEKMFGVFEQTPLLPLLPIFRGFDNHFNMPHSRHTEVRREDISQNEALTLVVESEYSGVGMVMARGGREFFIMGHLEYAPNTLDTEFKRDWGKRTDVSLPQHYYPNNDPTQPPLVTWRAHANLLFSNWINYYVYQETPYNINDIK